MPNYPSTVAAFPTRTDGQTIFAQHMNAVQDEIAAVEAALLGTLSHPLTLGNALGLTGQITPPQITADQHDYNPAGLALVFQLRLAADAARTITGLAAQPLGRVVVLQNIGTFPITLAHDHAGSAAANRFLLPDAVALVLGANASAFLLYDSGLPWRVIAVAGPAAAAGAVVDVAYNATNFTASAGTWTVEAADQVTFAYILDGKLLTLFFEFGTTSISAIATNMNVKLPAGLVAARNCRNTGVHVVNNGSHAIGLAAVAAGGTTFALHAGIGTAQWGVSVNNSSMQGQFTLPVQ